MQRGRLVHSTTRENYENTPHECGVNDIADAVAVRKDKFIKRYSLNGWWRCTVVERRSLAGELSLSCARPAADG